MCVQNFDDSLSSAIRIKYRSSQRSSSMCEPRHPLLKVVEFQKQKLSFLPLNIIFGFKGVKKRLHEKQIRFQIRLTHNSSMNSSRGFILVW
jgi:hypothetical protein